MKAIILYLSVVILTSCVNKASEDDKVEKKPKTMVTLTSPSLGNIREEIVLSGTTTYLRKTIIASPIAAFIVKSNVQIGDIIKKGQVIYTLETKENRALSVNGEAGNGLSIPVKSGISGMIVSVAQNPGGYVTEGTTLCEVADLSSLTFEINVPFEQRKTVLQNNHCTIILPDDTHLRATVSQSLATMNAASQAQQVLAYAKAFFLPEGMNVKVLVEAGISSRDMHMILPKSAVLSDETQSRQWVMKLINDSTAVKVPVGIGNCNKDSMEVLSTALSLADRIILTGGYAMNDTCNIIISK